MLTPDVLAAFEERGFVIQPRVFVFDEIAWVRDEARVVALRRGQAGRAREGDAWASEAPPGTIYGAHLGEAAFGKLARHPRIVQVARDLLGEDVYLHQSRLITRVADALADFAWRRDFSTWSEADGLPTPRTVTAAIVLGQAAPQEPALHVVPGSHRRADEPGQAGSVSLAAPLGSVVFYGANLAYAFHRPSDRRSSLLYLVSYNAVSNAPTRARRGEAFATRRAVPIAEEADDCMWPAAWCAAG